jgi:hypothetical protein
VGGTKDYCAGHCKAINGGTLRKNVFTWFWVRSSLPKRLWKKCMDYQVKRNDGKLMPYKLVGHSVVPVEVYKYFKSFYQLLEFGQTFSLTKVLIKSHRTG